MIVTRSMYVMYTAGSAPAPKPHPRSRKQPGASGPFAGGSRRGPDRMSGNTSFLGHNGIISPPRPPRSPLITDPMNTEAGSVVGVLPRSGVFRQGRRFTRGRRRVPDSWPDSKSNPLPAGSRAPFSPESPVCGISGPDDWVWQSISSFSFFSGHPVKNLRPIKHGNSGQTPSPAHAAHAPMTKWFPFVFSFRVAVRDRHMPGIGCVVLCRSRLRLLLLLSSV